MPMTITQSLRPGHTSATAASARSDLSTWSESTLREQEAIAATYRNPAGVRWHQRLVAELDCRAAIVATPAPAVITISSPDADGAQHFALNGEHLYSLWVIDSIRGTRYAVRPHGHIGRTFIGSDRAEAFMHAVDFTELGA